MSIVALFRAELMAGSTMHALNLIFSSPAHSRCLALGKANTPPRRYATPVSLG
jgi:hypothetical protein